MASPLTVQPSSKDTYVSQNLPDNNYGTVTPMTVESTTFGTPDVNKRVLITFPIVWGTDIPVGATIIGATFSMYASLIESSNGRTYWAYKQTRNDWSETQATWNVYKAGSSWTAPGGDFVTSSPVGGSVVVPASAGWMDWNILAIVQDAQTNSIDVNLLVKDATESANSTIRDTAFYSREYTSDTTLCPKLVITYTGGGPSGYTHKPFGQTISKFCGVSLTSTSKVCGV